jgi:hypothetical protein
MANKISIHVVKTGNTVHISLGGKLIDKNCGNPKEADELFKIVLAAKENPSEDNLRKIRAYVNEKLRVAYLTGLEHDPDTGEVFLAGFNTPIPQTLVDIIREYHENKYPLTPIFNFWKLLMINPDKRVRESLFKFITAHDFSLTDMGYMIVYKAVYLKDQKPVRDTTYEDFISTQYLHVKNNWKCSPNKYVVYKNLADFTFAITKYETAKTWDEKEKNIEILGKLGDIYSAIVVEDNKPLQYTDMYSQTMTIELGVPAKKERKDCDANPDKNCSNGLHCGATNYVSNYAKKTSHILVCFVNPMNVIAVPHYNHSKMRVSEYFPFALAEYDFDKKKISIIEEKYFENDYKAYEVIELEKLVTKVKSEEKPIEKAQNAEDEVRPMSELLKIIEGRMIDL